MPSIRDKEAWDEYTDLANVRVVEITVEDEDER